MQRIFNCDKIQDRLASDISTDHSDLWIGLHFYMPSDLKTF